MPPGRRVRVTHIPLYIDVSGKRVIVFGGGHVGERRARLFHEAGAEVIVAAAEFTPGLRELSSRGVTLVEIHLPKDRVRAVELIRSSWLVVVALSSPEAYRLVVEEARRVGVLLNNAVNSREGDVVVPYRAVLWDSIHLASTSLGETGVAARRVLEEAVALLEGRNDLRLLYGVMRRVKREMKNMVPDPRARFRIHLKISGDPLFNKYIREGDGGNALRRAYEIIEESMRDTGGA